jgi:hypothetical protein
MLPVFDGSSKLSLCVLCFFAWPLPRKVFGFIFFLIVSSWTRQYSRSYSSDALYFEFIMHQLNFYHTADETSMP